MKPPKFPNVLTFEHLRPKALSFSVSRAFYEVVGYRAPRKNEWFVSGAIPEAYKAFNDMTTPYWVVRPTFFAVATTLERRGERVVL